MYVRLEGGEVRDVKLRIYEPPRFFEAFLRGRAFTEAPDITARICGICPIAYQMSAVRAMEDACGVAIDEGPIRDLRRLIYCGEWIESHSLHVFMLHAPDFLGYPGAVEMAREHRELVERGLQLKKAGNAMMTLVGGREIHPINMRVGGFYRVPSQAELARWSTPWSGRARSRWKPCAGRPGCPSRTSSSSPSTSPCTTMWLSDRPRADRLRPRTGHRAGRVRRAHRGGPRRALKCAARAAARARQLPDGAAGALQPGRGAPSATRAGGRRDAGWGRAAATRFRASWCARSSSCRRATRRSR